MTRQKPNTALKHAEAEFAKRRAAIESDEDMSSAEKRDELLAAAAELEWATRSINEANLQEANV